MNTSSSFSICKLLLLLSLFGNGAIGWCTCPADFSTSVSLELCGDGVELDGWTTGMGPVAWIRDYQLVSLILVYEPSYSDFGLELHWLA